MDDLVVGIHVQTRDRVGVLDALGALAREAGLEPVRDEGVSPRPGTTRFLVAPPRGAWVSVYPEEPAQEGQLQLARDLTCELAGRLRAAAIMVGRLGEAAFFYLAADAKGQPGDEYHSCPEQALEVDDPGLGDATLEATRGDTARLATAVGGLVKPDALAAVLTAARVERLADCDPGQDRPGVAEGLAALAAALRPPDPYPDFDEVRHFVAEDDQLDMSLLAFRAPPRSRLEPVKALLAGWKQRRRAAAALGGGGGGSAAALGGGGSAAALGGGGSAAARGGGGSAAATPGPAEGSQEPETPAARGG